MKTFKRQAAQGDCLITLCNDDFSSAEWQKVEPEENNKFILAHSETGHHHTVPAQNIIMFRHGNNALILGIKVLQPTVLTHQRSYNTHEEIEIQPGTYLVRNQREYIHEGFRRALD